MPPPQRVTSSLSSLTLSWQESADNGGFPILSYAVFRNDGNDREINIEVNTNDDTNIRDKPSLRSMVITNFP